jgi:hypothetical protein
MDGTTLQDRIAKGLGVAARKVGASCIVYRPQGWRQPIVEHNRVIRLSAAFSPAARGFNGGEVLPVWQGIFDSAYTQAGDYLVGASATYFICSQVVGLSLPCVLTNRVISLARPTLVSQGGYSGAYASDDSCILERWPACVIERGSAWNVSKGGATGYVGWLVLLPPLPVTPRVADLMSDDAGSSYVVSAAEPGALGWRLVVKQLAA